MPLYNKAAGKVSTGLVRRRAAEVVLFNTPVAETAESPTGNTNGADEYDMTTIKGESKGKAVRV